MQPFPGRHVRNWIATLCPLTIFFEAQLDLFQNSPLDMDLCKINSANPTGKLKPCPCLLCLYSSLPWAPLPPQGLVMTLTSNLEVFLNGFWSNRRSADIPPSESLLVLCLKDEGGKKNMENTRNYVIKIFLLE